MVLVNCMVADGPEAGRHAWIDALRLFAGVSMVGLHVTADAQGQPFPDVEPAARVGPMLLRAALYSARTELFLMVSILLLLLALRRRPRAYGAVIGLQARRLLLPFLVWTVFYSFYGLMKAQAFGYGAGAMERLGTVQGWVGFLLLGDVKYHMHFIPTLFCLLLFYPVLRLAENWPVLGLAVVPALALKQQLDPLVYGALWGSDMLGYAVRAVKVVTYLGYGMVAGATLGLWRQTTADQRARWIKPVVAAAAGLFALKLMTTARVIQSGQWVHDSFWGYWADNLMPVVLLMLCLALAPRLWPAGIARRSRYAFGLYLCHPIFLDLAEVILADRALTPSQSIALELMWTLTATALFVRAVSRVPALAWTVGLGPLPRPRRLAMRKKIDPSGI